MEILKYFIFTLLCIIALTVQQAHAQSQSGFISIDCGISEISGYTDKLTGINYTSDATFIDTGVSKNISPEYNINTLEQQFLNVRSFPEGVKNCYTLKPEPGDTKFLIRARFMYGNYDGQMKLPSFNLLLEGDVWDSVEFVNASTIVTKEIIHIPQKNHIYVCLANTGSGAPFISALELRPLTNSTYTTESGSLLLFQRWDLGSTSHKTVRYRDDVHDRLWTPYNSHDWTIISNSLPVYSSTFYEPPSTVMRTAIIPANGSNSLLFTLETSDSKFNYYFYLHFAEVEEHQANQSRELNIYVNGRSWYGPLVPQYLRSTTIRSLSPTSGEKNEISINKTENSSLPPILNTLEIYRAKEFPQLLTNEEDVNGIMNIKSKYGFKRSNWQGDPCTPEVYLWQGLNCSYDDYISPRIISLNLSSSGIAGEICPYISSLTSLQILDLSNNSLTGPVPDFLSQLPFLSVLNLSGNKLSGTVPAGLMERKENGLLSLSVEGNLDLYTTVIYQEKNNYIVPIVAAVVSMSVFLTAMAILWSFKRRKQENKWCLTLIVVGAGLMVPLLCYLCYLIWRKNRAKEHTTMLGNKLLRELGDNESTPAAYGQKIIGEKDENRKHELNTFNFHTIVAATNNFSNTNVLGKGGFGAVYKGILLDGREIAIKRLSRSSNQGVEEFQNEVKLIAKLQHTNLVRLLGCSLQGDERILVYEYMPNKSLDFFIFDSHRKKLLNWDKRVNIIEGIAQGLVYLHKFSRLRVIHRDLKASNILLDDQMNPKISDFGMAKIFGVNESIVNTNRVVGTYGYMSPEYAMNGIVSIKTDVYSFGVLVLEIVSGKKNNCCYHAEIPLNLVGHAWQLWNKGEGLELKDPTLDESCSQSVLRCLHVGLLCVQDQATDRPTMSDVVSMLINETILLPPPKQPAFYVKETIEEVEISRSKLENCSMNNVTISVMEAR